MTTTFKFARGAAAWLLALTFALSGAAAAARAQTPGAATQPAAGQQQPSAQQQQQQGAAATAAAREAADSLRLVTEFEVNGLRVLVKRREGGQSVVAGLFLRGGARNVTAENAGVEALMLEVATEATQKFPREQLRRELSRTGTQLSDGINLDYSVLSLASTRRHFDRSWEIFADAALNPRFTPEDFERTRNRFVVSLSDNEDTPDSFLQILQSRVAYAGHPYLNDPRGTAATVGRLTLDDVKAFHRRMMETSRLLLVVVGDVDPAQIRRKVEASFGRLPRGDYRAEPVPQLAFRAPTVAVTERALPTNYVQGVFAAPAPSSPDIYAMRIAQTVLQNRVFVEVRVKRNLSYAPDAFLWTQGANLGGISVSSTDASQSVRLMLEEIRRLQTQEISPDEIKATAQHFLTRYYMGQETNAAQAGELAQYELVGGGWRNSAVFIERLRAVTPADVRRAANTYMRNLQFVVLGDPRAVSRDVFPPPAGE
ncbi:MAG TPA: pitrilysin family protein [Pyrinomonadaceae bacterium]|jgi:zinc protease